MKDNFHWKVFKRMMYKMMIEFAVPLFIIGVVGLIILCVAYPWLAVVGIVAILGMVVYAFWEDAKADILEEENET